MREQVLAEFLRGTINPRELGRDLEGSVKRVGETGAEIEDMNEELEVTSEMAIALCDAVLADELPAEALEIIGFAMLASDKFLLDAGRDEVLHDWAAPEVNSPHTE